MDIGYDSREKLIRQTQLRLADGMIDVELDRDHYDAAIDLAVARFRQRSGNATEESVIFIQTQPDQNEYVLPNEVIEVERLYRRGVGGSSGTGSNFDPFDAAFNNMYLLNAGQIGGIATFEFFSQYKETISRVFGSEYDFNWNRNSHRLTILRNIKTQEEVAITAYMYVPENILLQDVYASNWLASFTLAQSKMMLGEARSKYVSGLPGAGGAVQLNGEQLKTEAQQEISDLDEQLSNLEDGSEPLGFIIG